MFLGLRSFGARRTQRFHGGHSDNSLIQAFYHSYNLAKFIKRICIFKSMRRRGLHIFSVAFIGIFTLLQVQPLLLDPTGFGASGESSKKAKMSTCPKMKKPVCSASKCNAPMGVPEEDGCGNDGCNPFRTCSTGLCCYLVEGFIDYNTAYILTRKKIVVANDNRVATSLSECWRPPKLVS